jgi:hypothetical protein
VPQTYNVISGSRGTIRQGGLVMRQREWVTSTLDDCPVPEEVIGLLYRSSHNRVYELISGLSAPHRASLATFCYGRAHLREVGLAIAATCEFDVLVAAGGRVGNFLFEQSRELPDAEKSRSVSNQIKVSLAPVNFGESPGQSRM